MGGKGKRLKAKAKAESKVKVYRRAYHVSTSQSLAQLNAWPSREERESAGLRGRWASAVHRPIGQLDVEQLVLLLTQGVDAQSLHYLWPVIFERLEANICASAGSSLLALLVGRNSFWQTHPHARTQLVELIAARQVQLETARDESLADLASRFAGTS